MKFRERRVSANAKMQLKPGAKILLATVQDILSLAWVTFAYMYSAGRGRKGGVVNKRTDTGTYYSQNIYTYIRTVICRISFGSCVRTTCDRGTTPNGTTKLSRWTFSGVEGWDIFILLFLVSESINLKRYNLSRDGIGRRGHYLSRF